MHGSPQDQNISEQEGFSSEIIIIENFLVHSIFVIPVTGCHTIGFKKDLISERNSRERMDSKMLVPLSFRIHRLDIYRVL